MFHVEHAMNISFPCPSCGHHDFLFDQEVQDHFLSQERFSLYRCGQCGLMKTEPFPAPEEIGKYYESDAYLSHGDDKRGLFASLYRGAKKYNLGWKGRLLHSLHRHGTFLDYGCGTGDLLSHMHGLGHAVRGAEPNATALAHSSPLVRDHVVSPEEELASDRSYDIISLWHVAEHLYTPKETLGLLVNKLNEGGHLIIAVPNPTSHDARHYGPHWAGLDVPRHLWHFAPAQMIALGEGLGLTHRDTLPMWMDAFYVSLLSARYKGQGAASGLFRGLLSNLSALGDKKRRCSSQVYLFQLENRI